MKNRFITFLVVFLLCSAGISADNNDTNITNSTQKIINLNINDSVNSTLDEIDLVTGNSSPENISSPQENITILQEDNKTTPLNNTKEKNITIPEKTPKKVSKMEIIEKEASIQEDITIQSSPSCGSQINESFNMTSNLVGCTGDGFIINADNITIDCANHKIEGDLTADKYGIKIPAMNNITIINCEIIGFDVGIFSWGSSKLNISNNSIHNNSVNNIGSGIIFGSGMANVTIDNNNISYNLYNGIRASDGQDVENLTIKGNLLSGYSVGDSPAIYLGNSVNHSYIYNNYFANNPNANSPGESQHVVDYAGSIIYYNISNTPGPNIIGGDTISGNFWDDYTGQDNNHDGLGDTYIPYNASRGINSNPGGDFAPLVQSIPPLETSKSSNSSSALYGDAITFTINLTNNGNTNITSAFVQDDFNETEIMFINATCYDSYNNSEGWIDINFTNCFGVLENGTTQSVELNFSVVTQDIINTTNYAIINATDGTNNFSENSNETVELLGDGFTEIDACAETNIANGHYRLNKSLTSESDWRNNNFNWDCFNLLVGADNVILDCAGYSIVGNTSAKAFLIQSNNVTIKNCNIKNVSQAFGILNSEGHNITNNTISSYEEMGISLNNVNDSHFTLNSFDSNNTIIHGIEMSYAFENSFKDNYFSNMPDHSDSNPMILLGSNNQTCSKNIINNNKFTNVTIGVQITNGGNNNISYNTFRNGDGFVSTRSIMLQEDSTSNLIWRNELRHNLSVQDNGIGNKWNLSAPIGGNNWTGLSEEGYTCNDGNADGFCDDPLRIDGSAGSYDFLPINGSNGTGSREPLNITLIKYTNDENITNGSIVTYVINITNNDVENITNLTLLDEYNETQLDYNNETNLTENYYWDINNDTIEWFFNLSINETISIEVNFTVNGTSGTEVINEVILEKDNESIAYDNETFTISTSFDDIYENDNNYTNANLIPVNGTKQQHTFSFTNDTDYIKFNTKEGGVYVIETDDLVDDTDTMINLYDTDGTSLLETNDDIYIGNPKSKLEWTAPTTGTYFVMINDYNENMTNGTYNVSITEYAGLNFTLITPSSDINVTKNESFNFTVNVTCLGVDCENISIYLDPKVEKPVISQSKVFGNLLDNINNLEDKDYEVIIKLKDKKIITTKKGKKVNLGIQQVSILNNKDLLSSIKESNIQVQDSVIASLGNDFVLERQNKAINSMSGIVNKAGLIALASNPNVEIVNEVQTYHIDLDVSTPHIGADDAWNTEYRSENITGQGQTVCIIDTGIDYTHADFGGYGGFPNAKIVGGYDFYNDDSDPMDDHGHGTHCAGIVASENPTYTGVAPDANLVAIKACSNGGSCPDADIESGVDWCVNNATKYNITAISISLGGNGPYQEYCDESNTLAQAINNANNLGIAVVVAAGNNGWRFGVSSPACASGAITVSATDNTDDTDGWVPSSATKDIYCGQNNSAYPNCNGFNRGELTDLFAPGISIEASNLGGGETTKSGTSMSTPHVAGAVALINQYYKLHDNDNLHSNEVKYILENTGVPIADSESGLTIPRVNITSAISSAIVKGVIPMNSGSPFYTTNQNPQVVNLSANRSIQLNWTVNATGNEGTYDFFVFANVSDEIEDPESNHVNITIENQTIANDNITSCRKITSPGIYKLGSDLSGAPYTYGVDACIIIKTSDVELDCNEHKLSNDGTNYGILIRGTLNNVTVKNCDITNYSKGVAAMWSTITDSLIDNITVNGGNTGIYLETSSGDLTVRNSIMANQSSSGFRMNSSSGFDFINNEAYGASFGFSINSDNCSFINNTAHNNTIGFSINTGEYNNLTNNVAYGNTQSGIGVSYSESKFNRVINNKLYQNSYGINSNLDVNNTFINNTIYKSTGSYGGFYIEGSVNNTYNNNVVANQSTDGFYIISNAENHIFLNNEIYNTTVGFYIWDHVNNLTLKNNVIYNNSKGILFWDTYDLIIENNNISNNTNEGIYSDGDNITIFNNTIKYNNKGIYLSSSYNNTIESNIIENNGNLDIYSSSSNEVNLLDQSVGTYYFDYVKLIVENSDYGKIEFLNAITESGDNLNSDIVINNKSIFVNSTAQPGFNVSANITLNNLSFNNPMIEVDLDDNDVFIECNSTTNPSCTELNWNGSTFVFNVSHFTEYRIVETPIIYNVTIKENSSYVEVDHGDTTTFTLNVTNTGNQDNIVFNLTVDNYDGITTLSLNQTQITLDELETGNVTLTVGDATPGIYEFTINVTQDDNASVVNATSVIKVNVTGPEFEHSLNNFSISENDSISYDINCTDVNGDTLTYYINDSGNFNLNSNNGSFIWNTSYNDSGNYLFEVTCGDATYNVSQIMEVNITDVPILVFDVTKTLVGNSVVLPNTTISYNITISHQQDGTLNVVNLNDTYNTNYLSYNGSSITPADGTDDGNIEFGDITNILTDVGIDSEISFIINFTTKNNFTNGTNNTVIIHAYSTSGLNNTDTDYAEVSILDASVLINKNAATSTVAENNEEYTLNISNIGAVNLTNLTVTDTIPNGLTFVSGSSNLVPSISGKTLTWNLSTLNISNETIITYNVTVDNTVKTNCGVNCRNNASVNAYTPQNQTINDNTHYDILINNSVPILTQITTQVITEDIPNSVNLSNNMSDADSDDTLTLFVTNYTSSKVTCSVNGDNITMTPATNYYGNANCTILVGDGEDNSTEVIFNITVNGVNDAPTLSSISNQTIIEDTPGTVDVVSNGNDVDGDSLTISVKYQNTSEVTCSVNGDNITMTPATNYYGNATCNVTVNDGVYDSNEIMINISVTAVNDAPTLSSMPNQNITEDVADSVNVSSYANDVDGNSLTFIIADENVSEVDCTVNGDNITMIPAANYSGTANCDIVVNDGNLNSTKKTMNITVTAVNDAPILDLSLLTVTLEEDSTNDTINLSNYAYDNDTALSALNWNCESNETDVLVSASNTTKLLNITATNNFNGLVNITCTVYDINSNDVDDFIANITAVNDAPVLNMSPINPQDLEEDHSVSVALLSMTTDVDNTESEMNYSCSDNETDFTSQANNATKILDITSLNNFTGFVNVTCIVTDGQLNDTDSFVVNVTPVNDAPELDFNNLIYNITEDIVNSSLNLSNYAYDNDTADASLNWNCHSNETDISLSPSNTTKLLTITPTNNFTGLVKANCTVFDSEYNVSDVFTINITNVNDNPIINSTAITTAAQDISYSYNVSAFDIDPTNDVMNFSLTTFPTNMIINSTTGLINWTPDETQIGTNGVVVRVEDGLGGFDTQSFDIEVNNTNDAPNITSTAVTTATQGTLYTYDVNAVDPDEVYGDNISYLLTLNPTGMTIDNSTGIISWTPNNDDAIALSKNVSVLAIDEAGSNDTQNFTINITNINDAPSINTTAITIASEDVEYSYDVNASDVDLALGDNLTFSLDLFPSGMNINPASGNITWTPTDAQVGNHSITVRVTDNASVFDTQDFNISVSGTNDNPIITSTPVENATNGTLYTYDVNANDPENDTLTYSFVNNITAPVMSINSTNGLISWTPDNTNVNHSYQINVTVNDTTDGFAIQKFNISVIANITPGVQNQPPVINSTPILTATEDILYQYNVTALDPESDTLTFSLIAGPSGMVINNNGTINWTPTNAQALAGSNTHTITVRVNDTSNEIDEQSFTITVNNTNDNPIIISVAVTAATEDVQYSYDVDATDEDGDTLTYNLSLSPTGMTIAANGNITWTPTNSQVGNNNVSVNVTDGNGGSDEHNFTITVSNTNDAPVIVSTPSTEGVMGQVYNYQINATDEDGDSLTYTLSNKPGTMNVNSSGYITWTADVTGNNSVTIVVDDSNGGIDNQSFTILVDDDNDGDGIGNENDTMNGNVSDVSIVGISSLNITVNNNDNLSNVSTATGTATVAFSEGNATLIEFSFNFASETILNLSAISISRTASNTSSTFTVHGLPSGITKSIYMNNTVNGAQSICIDDNANASVSGNASSCDAGETQINCPGSSGVYSCAISGSYWKISGLSHSAVKQSTSVVTTVTPSGGSSGGSGGSNHNNEENTTSNKCYESWMCNPWSSCENNIQERTCFDANACGTLKFKPKIVKNCSIEDEINNTIENIVKDVPEPKKEDTIKQPDKSNIWWIILIIVIILGLIGQFAYYFKKHIL